MSEVRKAPDHIKALIDKTAEKYAAEEQAAWAEYKVGRPKLGSRSSEGHSPQITFRIPAETREVVLAYAHAEGVTLSTFARHAVEHYITFLRDSGRNNA